MREKQSYKVLDRGRVADQILDDMRDQILRGVLAHGTRLPAERELAEQYGVSGATIREAVRALTAMGLVSVRHGSGSYVTARGDTLIAMSIASVVQLESVGAAGIVGVLGSLHAHAAELAVTQATRPEIALLRQAAERLAVVATVTQTVADLKDFLQQLSAMSHNPLLAALCKALVELQVGLALDVSGGKLAAWKRVAGRLHAERLRIVEALECRDADRAVALVRAYHQRTLELIAASPKAQRIRHTDPQLAQLVASLMGGRAVRDAALDESEKQ
ncbi:MAG: bacterial regulatory s, gntR family protein [Rhodospirillales bacterium]|nr:bacterial regulatory s, gntR family protein [Rhodospirillales bacterium]